MRRTSATTTTRWTRTTTALGLVAVIAAIIGPLVDRSGSPVAPSFGGLIRGDDRGATTDDRGAITEDDAAVTEDDGVLPDGVTAFDDEYPGVANLDTDLLQAVREAAADAGDDGIELDVTSGWRSLEYQDQLLREAVVRYGSEREAARWVATGDTSPHVFGDAVDIGSIDATAWLSEHGARYGLCQIYRNEPWHFELRPGAIERACPPMYTDPTQDPRMQR